MKNIISKITAGIMVFGLMMQNKVSAEDIGDPTKIGEAIELIKPTLNEYVKPISAVLVFLGVIMVGFNIILNRGKADERTNAMWGLFAIGCGAAILGSAGIIYSFVMSLAVA
ncbi:MAG: hypothetical protein MJ246_00870 [Clostridia bacterium]|nr:hypothetical protein [Clostridia bacterium]